MERTFVAVKPDGVQRGLVGEIIGRFEKKGFKLVGLKLMHVPRTLAEAHYTEHKEKPFFGGLVDFMTSSPIVAMVWEGPKVVETIRTMMGSTNPLAAAPGTVRGDFGCDLGRNVIHGSDSVASAEREIGLFFEPQDIVGDWARTLQPWLIEG
ncbi:MAG: nucleoside-diphosphate kinase [Vampirovibrionales bacterium]